MISVLDLALLCLGAFLAVFYSAPRLRKLREGEWERRMQAAMERELDRLVECEPQIRQLIAAGGLRYLVEWWEDDALEIDENHHLLFIYTDETAHEFSLYQEVEDKCVALLAEYGIEWTPGFKLTFDSNILYPPSLRSRKFFTPDGRCRGDLPQ